ncbi:alpha/beta hydrolase [Geomesophilobacter sediminis]|uniref:Alpha/beta hydrolase n=1 Tax=Geomesophilobacter sediminis TaxID=2798584 RepID=A0A8J7J442_9BACT|nr:alpha/beta hydrolase [Geomesophilobacter sediminis]MBJ6725503.1 alpha/beta hydrolase [Geomesophilobacter sediminis]
MKALEASHPRPVNTAPQTRRARWMIKPLILLAALILFPVAVGALYQYVLTARDLYRYTPPGRLVEVNGHRLHLLVTGPAGKGSGPTVVLETGLGGIAWCWSWIQPEVAKFARVVSYDRPGLGWSDPDGAPFTPAHYAVNLHTALAAAGIPGPYLLVGHSMGGLLVRVFNDLYPNEVAGMVLIEPCHPEQSQCNPFVRQATEAHMKGLKIRQILTYIGYERGFGDYFDQNAKGMPRQGLEQARTVLSLYRHVKWTNSEASMWDDLCAYVRNTRGLGDKPLLVVTGDQGLPPGFLDLEADLTRLSSRGGLRLIRGATHLNLIGERENALQVVQAIRDVYQQATVVGRQLPRSPERHPLPALRISVQGHN